MINSHDKAQLRANLLLRGHVVKFMRGPERDIMSGRFTLDCLYNGNTAVVLTPLDQEEIDGSQGESSFISVEHCRIYIGDKDWPLREVITFAVSEM